MSLRVPPTDMNSSRSLNAVSSLPCCCSSVFFSDPDSSRSDSVALEYELRRVSGLMYLSLFLLFAGGTDGDGGG